jgi:hypothetical protein
LKKEIIMKSFLLFIALLFVVTLSSGSAPTVTNAARAAKTERAVMRFDRPVTLMDVTLRGEYLFVHDDAAMARGASCTYVYKGTTEDPNSLVVAFHCTPVQRNRVDYFTVRTSPGVTGDYELREFQFKGSTEAHLVPMNLHDAHVAIVPVN